MNIKELQEYYDEKQENLINEIDKKFMDFLVIPFCNKYNLSFVSGNGTYFFSTNRNKTIKKHIDYYSKKCQNTTFWKEYLEIDNFFNENNSIYGYDYKRK